MRSRWGTARTGDGEEYIGGCLCCLGNWGRGKNRELQRMNSPLMVGSLMSSLLRVLVAPLGSGA